MPPGNPNMRKGAPSVNPSGRSPAELTAIAKAKQAPGYDGVQATGGYVNLGEGDRRLQGSQRWKTFAQLWRTCPPVPIWSRLRLRLLAGITWSLKANETGMAGSATERAAAERGVELVEQALLKARLGTGPSVRPWPLVAARAMNGAAAFGFSLNATAVGRRKRDGLVVFTDIANRPQSTVTRWFRVREDDMSPFARVEQQLSNGRNIQLDLVDCLYLVTDNGTGSESPMGTGMLDLIAERARQAGVYESIIGTEVASSMGGIPISRAPLQEMSEQAKGKLGHLGLSDSDLASRVVAVLAEKTRALREFLANRFKDPTKLPWFELDSAVYQTIDGNPSSTPKWGVEIVKGELQGVTESHPIAREFILDVARILGVEHVFVGGGDTAGTYGMHESKISALAADLSAEAGIFARVADDQLVRSIVAANGEDPDIAAPSLQPSPVMRADVLKAVQAIAQLNMAGLSPNHPAKRAVFEGVDLPWQEEEEPTLPRFSSQFPLRSAPAAEETEVVEEGEKPEPKAEVVTEEDREREEQPE